MGPPNAVCAGELLVGVDVDLSDGRISLRGQAFDDGFEHLTGTTPVGVEVREDDIVLGDDIVKLGLAVDVERFTRGSGASVGCSIGCHHEYVHTGDDW